MSEKFTASNGVKVWLDVLGAARTDIPTGSALFPGSPTKALREFFLHERDQELGRWRWPEYPNYVVYPVGNDGLVDVLRESSMNDYGPGRKQGIDRAAADAATPDAVSGRFYLAARAYFEAHPAPKPWLDARPGEVWSVKYEGRDVRRAFVTRSAQYDGLRFMFEEGTWVGVDEPEVIHAMRVFPEVDGEC